MTLRTPEYLDNRYAAQRRAGFRWLQFVPDLEREYRENYLQYNATRLRLAHCSAIALLLGFIVIDVLYMEVLPRMGIGILLGVTTPALALPILATAFRGHGRITQQLVFGCGLVMALSTTVVAELGRLHNPWFPYEALLLVIMYAYFIAGLHYLQAATVGLSIWAAFLVLEALWMPNGRATLVYESYFLFVANAVGLLGLYFLQHESRRAFLLQNELRQDANLDPLTGMLNRREFRRHFDAAWLQARRDKTAVGLLMLDIDNFKSINDQHGHLTGDAALKAVGDTLCSLSLRPLDAVGRFGGDEFIAVWFGVEPLWFSKMTRDLPARIARLPVPGAHGDGNVSVSISGGAVFAKPTIDSIPHDAIRIADEKLYESKRDGSGRISLTVLVPKNDAS